MTSYLSIAKQMMGYTPEQELPKELIYLLDNTNYYTSEVGGRLVSRQVVAAIIVFWKKCNENT